MRWLRRKEREQDLERELRSDLELEARDIRREACRRQRPDMPPAGH
jgi:hypothetical protein